MKKGLKKLCSIFIIFGILCTTFGGVQFSKVFAESTSNMPKLEIKSNNNIAIDTTDTNKIVYKIGDNIAGSAKVKIGNTYIQPVVNSGKIELALTEHTGENYQVIVEVMPESGYQTQQNYFFDGVSDSFPGDMIVNLDITANKLFILDFCFEVNNNNQGDNNNQQPGDAQPPVPVYPVVAYFEGIENGVTMNPDGVIVLPNGWTKGKVSFKAKVCKVEGEVAPDDGFNIPDEDSKKEEEVRIEGIANGNQINNTVTKNENYINISEAFSEYGKVTIHITGKEPDSEINTIISIQAGKLINIKAEAPIDMSYSLASSAVNQAIITKDVVKDLSIFFGNTETTITASGSDVVGITKVVGGKNVVINDDGTATISLPDLSVETTTQVKVTIKMKDDSTITRTVNIVRTAIMLEYDDRDNKLFAGYVMNKGYLYNNKAHSDDIFDAYLQVILYKDNVVAGYKQIQIDDKEVVNRLQDNEAWSLELYSDYDIVIYDGSIEGVNKVSVFLTNGPISYDSDKLPSIEFGIGSGLTIEFGGEE